MSSRGWSKYVALIAVLAMMLPGGLLLANSLKHGSPKDQPSAASAAEQECAATADRVSAAIAEYVGRFAGMDGFETKNVPALTTMASLRDQAAQVRAQLASADCPLAGAHARVAKRLKDLRANGPLAEAVRDAVVANVLDVLGADRGGQRVVLRPGEDLRTALGSLTAGSTLVLPRGRLRIDGPLLVLQDVVVTGAGRDRTKVESSAGRAAVLLAAPVKLGLARLSLRHVGHRPASLLVMAAGQADVVDVHLSGARVDHEASTDPATTDLLAGGSGLVILGARKVQVRSTEIEDNDRAGVVVGGRAAPVVRGSLLVRNGTCGICYLARSRGELRANRLTGNGVGVLLSDTAFPRISDNRIQDNARAGVVAQHRAHPVIRGNRITGNGQVGLAAYDAASPRLLHNTVTGHSRAGVVVDAGAGARPVLTGNDFADNGQAAMVLLGSSRAQVTRNTCSGGRFQIVLGQSSAPAIAANGCTVTDQRR